MEERHLFAGDFQVPYHDPKAVEVFMQIGEVLKPHTLTINGDFGDWNVLSTRFPQRRDEPTIVATLREEIEEQRALLKQIVKRIKPAQKFWNDGNHEFRLIRELRRDSVISQLLTVEKITKALTVEAVLGLSDFGFKHHGEYCTGFWLRKTRDHINDVWVEHGRFIRKKSGAGADAHMQDIFHNTVTGHGHRPAAVYKHTGDRDFFGVEGGSLMDVKRAVYSTYPHNTPDLMNHQQGFAIVTYDAGLFGVELVHIVNGKSWFRGKLYKA